MAIQRAAGTTPAAFGAPTTPEVTLAFEPTKGIVIVNEDATPANYIEVSFDGVTVHGRLTPTVLAGLRFEQRVTKIWLRRGAGTPAYQIVAES